MERQEFTIATASQRLNFRSPWGRPTAAPTIGTATSGGTVLTAAVTTYTTLDTVNTTLTATAAVGARSIVLASVTGVAIGTRYLLTSIYGQTEQVKVNKIVTSTKTVYLTEPLRIACSLISGASYGTFSGVEFYYTLQSTDYGTLREMNIAKAVFTAGGLPRVMRGTFDIVNVPLNAPGPLTAEAVYERLGRDLANMEPDEQSGEDFEPQRLAAWNVVRRSLYHHGDTQKQWRPAMIVDPSDLFQYGCSVFTRLCHEQGISVIRTTPPPTLAELTQAEEVQRMMAFSNISWLDEDDSETKTDNEVKPLIQDLVR